MLILLPFLCFFNLTVLFFDPKIASLLVRLLVSFTQSLLIWVALTYFITELCAAFNLITQSMVAVCWLLALILSFTTVQFNSQKIFNSYTFFWREIKHIRLNVNSLSTKILLYASALLIIFPLFLLAIFTPPNNHDAMSYHCARVMHWLQNQNIEHYPTSYTHQLSATPLAEYLILHFQVLSGYDYLSNFVQFGAMLGSLGLILLIAKQLRLPQKHQINAFILALTVPMGLFQATSTQNDYVAALFLLASVYFGLTQQILWLALAIALGGLTKYTVWIVGLPFYLWFGIRFILRNKIPFIIQKSLPSLLLILVISAPNMYRNYLSFGNIIGEKELNTGVTNEQVSLENTFANLIHNTSNHLGLPSAKYNLLIDEGIHSTLRFFHISQNSAARNYLGIVPETTFGFTEDTVGNLWTGWLLLLAVVVGAWQWAMGKYQPTTSQKLFYLCMIGSYVLFAALLKWQPWHPRLQLGQTLLSTLVIALILSCFFSTRTMLIISATLIMCALPIVFINKSKPVIYPEYTVRKLTNAPNERIEKRLFEQMAANGKPEALVLVKNYEHRPDLYLYFLRPTSTPREREVLIDFFDKNGLYKNQSIMNMTRNRALMLNRKEDYQTFEALTDTLKKYNIKNIGLNLLADFTEYPLWMMTKKKLGRDAQLRYIRYPSILKNTPNSATNFEYRAVVSSFGNVFLNYPKNQIMAHYVWPRVSLIILKSPTNQVFTY